MPGLEVEATYHCGRHAAHLPHHELGRARELVGDGDLRRVQLVAGPVADTAEVEQRGQARDAERDIGRPLPERAAEGVADDHAHVAAGPLANRVAQPCRRRVGIERQQDECAVAPGVRGIDAGRGADEAVARLGDDQRRSHADDVSALLQDPLDVARVAVVGELERPRRRLDVVQPHDAALGLRDRLLCNDEDVRVLEAARALRGGEEEPSEIVAVLDLGDPGKRDHPKPRSRSDAGTAGSSAPGGSVEPTPPVTGCR